MTDTQTCKACGETKPLDAYVILASGRPRGTCKACRTGAATARKRTDRERSAHTQRVSNARHQLRLEIREDLWAALRTGRARRASIVVRPRPEASHRLPLADGTGYISISEFASRCLEREALDRARKLCKTHADTPQFVRELEEGSVGLVRSKRMNALARGHTSSPTTPRQFASGVEEVEADPFLSLFGDWPQAGGTGLSPQPAYA